LLLDIELPGMDGYAFCRALKDDPATRQVPTLFVSSHDTIEERLQGYDAGGDDFIVKPFAPDELLRKVRVARQVARDKASLQDQVSMAEQLSALALASMDESGLVLQFMSKLIAWNTAEEIAQGLLDLMHRYGLKGTTQANVGPRAYTLGEEGPNLPLEVSVMNHVRTMETIFEFRKRAVFNYGRAAAMVANMPVHDADFCGRIRDNLAIAVAGANSRLEAIEADEAIRATVAGIADTLTTVRQFHDFSCSRTSQLVYEIGEELARSFVHLGLTVGQENQIEELVKRYMNEFIAINDEGAQILTSLQNVSSRLSALRLG
jgi:CheY-like chemotaxis protein